MGKMLKLLFKKKLPKVEGEWIRARKAKGAIKKKKKKKEESRPLWVLLK